LLHVSAYYVIQLAAKVPQGKAEECGRIGHSIKGAAANLMCYKLRDAALAMERVGLAAVTKTKPKDQIQVDLEATHAGLIREMARFEVYLKGMGLI
jgi:chemotaxis protein histidine kinase CheA